MMPMKMSLACRRRSEGAGRSPRNWIGLRGWRCRSWPGMRAQERQMPTAESRLVVAVEPPAPHHPACTAPILTIRRRPDTGRLMGDPIWIILKEPT